MKEYITISLLLFALETLFHTSIIIISIVTWNQSYPSDFALFGWGYIKLKLIFFLLPYLIAHTYLIKNKNCRDGLTFGLFQVALFVGLTFFTLPVGGLLIQPFLTFESIILFLFCSFITPFIILKVAGDKMRTKTRQY